MVIFKYRALRPLGVAAAVAILLTGAACNGSAAQKIDPFTVIPLVVAYVFTRQVCAEPAGPPVASEQVPSG